MTSEERLDAAVENMISPRLAIAAQIAAGMVAGGTINSEAIVVRSIAIADMLIEEAGR